MENREPQDFSIYKEEALPLIDERNRIQERISQLEVLVIFYRSFFQGAAHDSSIEVSDQAKAYTEALKEIENLTPERDILAQKISKLSASNNYANEILQNTKSDTIN